MKIKTIVSLLLVILMLVIMPTTAQASDTYEGLTITGGNQGTDYSYQAGQLTIRSNKQMTLTGSTTMGIFINLGVTANLTLQNATIDGTNTNSGFAIYLDNGATLNLTILGNNTLKGFDVRAGIDVSSGRTLVITAASTGTLNVTGGEEAAGIGSSSRTSTGNITILNGTINAVSGAGAGIGGGYESPGGIIEIHGGTVKATSRSGAGIGGGYAGKGGDIAITGGVVEAKSTSLGAGIGGGYRGSGGIVDVSGGTVKAIGGGGGAGAGIGGGSNSTGGTVTISGGTIQALGNYGGEGIGGGLNSGNGGTVKITGGLLFARSGSLGAKDVGGNLEISGTAALFLVYDTCSTPITSTHTHINVTGLTSGASVYGYPIPWGKSFGAYLLLYPLSYDLGGGRVSSVNPLYYGPECASFTLNNPTRSGYTFTGWTGTGITEESISVTVYPSFTGGRYYTANWRPNTYTLNYDANGGTGSTDSSSHTYDATKMLTTNGFTRIGYTFVGWATSASGPLMYRNGQNVENLRAEDGATVTLYAKWRPITYTVSYNANGGAGSTAPSSHTYDGEKTLTANSFTKIGYAFAGWANGPEGEVIYSDRQSLVISMAAGNCTTRTAISTVLDCEGVCSPNSHF